MQARQRAESRRWESPGLSRRGVAMQVRNGKEQKDEERKGIVSQGLVKQARIAAATIGDDGTGKAGK